MDFLATFWGKLVTTFFISMVPIIELRGAIPWGEAIGLDLWISAVVSAFGNMLPVPFIILFIRKIFEWMRLKNEWLGNLVARFEAKAEKHKEKVKKYEFWGLFLFVAIPLPGTGAWTGALVAAMLEMRLKDAVPAILLGVVVATIVVSMITAGLFSAFSSIFG